MASIENGTDETTADDAAPSDHAGLQTALRREHEQELQNVLEICDAIDVEHSGKSSIRHFRARQFLSLDGKKLQHSFTAGSSQKECDFW